MSAFRDLTNQVFGRLIALRCVGRDKRGTAVWLCRCSCGTEKEVTGDHLGSEHTTSCGCLRSEKISARITGWNANHRGSDAAAFKHGHYVRSVASPTYSSWESMITRCTNPNHGEWHCYGGATPPVMIDSHWRGEHGFENFLSDMGERPEGTSLGRFGDIGNYEKSNCAWQTRKEQGLERRKHHRSQLVAA